MQDTKGSCVEAVRVELSTVFLLHPKLMSDDFVTNIGAVKAALKNS